MTLLQDVTLASTLFVGDWDGNYPLTVIFNGGDHTVTGKPGDPIFDVTRVGTLTINSGTFQTQVAASGNDYGCVSVTNGGTATITGGTFRQGESAAFMRGCVDVNYGGTATISGGAFESEGTDGYALYARLGSTTHLSGGTFKGNNPVVCEVRSDIQGRLFLKDLLLNSASASGQHYAFYQNGRPCDSSGTTLPAGTVTVKECTHEGAPVENLGGGTYRVDCPYCGHSYTYTTATPLTEDMVTLSETEVAYTGKPLTPDVTVTGLTAGTDYTVSYSNNTERGTATVTVTGMGKYTGKITKTFTIVYARLTKDVMLGAVSRPYEPGNRTVSLTSVSGVSKEAPEIAVRLIDVHGGQRGHVEAGEPHIHHNGDFHGAAVVLELPGQLLLVALGSDDRLPVLRVVVAAGHHDSDFFCPAGPQLQQLPIDFHGDGPGIGHDHGLPGEQVGPVVLIPMQKNFVLPDGVELWWSIWCKTRESHGTILRETLSSMRSRSTWRSEDRPKVPFTYRLLHLNLVFE